MASGLSRDPDSIPAALDELEKRSWHDIWATAVKDAVFENRIDLARFGPVQAQVVSEEPTEPIEPSLNLILGAGTPGAVEAGHLGDAIAWAACPTGRPPSSSTCPAPRTGRLPRSP